MIDPYAAYTRPSWEKVQAYWAKTSPCTIHMDNTFGMLVCRWLANGIAILEYEGWHVRLEPELAELTILQANPESSMDEQYVIERLALPILRLMRGAVLWHSGAVASDGHVHVMLAPSGVGKTTLTAAVLAANPNARLVCDDILALCASDVENETICLPSASHLAMRHDMFKEQSFISHCVSNGYKKILYLQKDKCLHKPQPLESIWLLESGQQTVPESMPVMQALPMILNLQMTLTHLSDDLRRYLFGACMRILRNCPKIFRQEIDLSSKALALNYAQNVIEYGA